MNLQEQQKVSDKKYHKPVLNSGFVELVDWMGNDESIVRAARVSYNADRNDNEGFITDKDAGLLKYLLVNNHTSPFEHVTFTFHIKAPLFVIRQWHRHRTWSYNEVSARYTEMEEDYYIPQIQHIGKQSEKNKQQREIGEPLSDGEYMNAETSLASYRLSCKESFEFYKLLLNIEKWPRELARMVLPLSTYSRFYGTVSLHNLFKFLELRMHSHAQWEIQEYARALYDLAKEVCPHAMEVWDQK